jgi:Cu-Zn family superoxide dismutase
MQRNPALLLFVICLALLLVSGCRTTTESSDTGEEQPAEVKEVPVAGPSAKAMLQALGESGVGGWVSFTAVDDGVQVEAQVTGLTPGKHGFHIHQWGDCSAPDGKSAGGHFNPEGVDHAGPGAAMAHAGDLGNLEADEEGKATLALHSQRIALAEAPENVLGRGVIVHELEDDLTSQPTGAAGGRLACGVIMLEGGETTPVLAPTE